MQKTKISLGRYKKRKGTQFRDIGDLVQNAIRKLGLDTRLKSHKVFDIWDEVVGGPVSKVTQPYAIKSKTLFVHVRDSVWMRQLKFLEEMIIEKITGRLKYKAVEKIHFKIGTHDSKRQSSMDKALSDKRILQKKLKKLTPPSLEAIESLDDPELKAALMRIRQKVTG